jgi:hypothetical protein
VQAYGGPGFVLTQSVMERFSAAVENGQIPIVPRTVVEMGGGDGPNGGGGGTNAFGLLMTLLATEKLTGEPTTSTMHDESVEALRKQILEAAAAGVRPVTPAPPADVAAPVPAEDAKPPATELDKPSR